MLKIHQQQNSLVEATSRMIVQKLTFVISFFRIKHYLYKMSDQHQYADRNLELQRGYKDDRSLIEK